VALGAEIRPDPIVAGPGPRAGAIGTIQSVYIRDPDL
jgi:hypothetical protein